MRLILSVALFLNLASAGLAQDGVPSSWLELGGSASGDGVSGLAPARSPAMALNPGGQPVVAWIQGTQSGNWVYVRRWNGTAWVEFGGSGSGSGIWPWEDVSLNHGHILALDGSGYPTVAYNGWGTSGTEVFLVRWNGSAWVELGGSATGGGISNYEGTSGLAALALSPAGNPCVAWMEMEGIHIRRWTGSSWESLSAAGVPYLDGDMGSNPSLSINAAGQPIVAWSHCTATAEVANPPRSEIRVKRWDGSGWVSIDGTPEGNGVTSELNGSSTPVMMILDASGYPVVAWEGLVGGKTEIFLRRWTGSSWIELGGSGSGNGISNTPGYSVGHSVALGPGSRPIVSWADQLSTGLTYETYVRQWDGAAWIELDGSASGGGISASPTVPTMGTTVAVSTAGAVYVCWEENNRVFLRWRPVNGVEALAQFHPDGVTPIPVGGPANQAAAILRGTPVSVDPSIQLRMQIEVRPVGIAFTGIPTSESGTVDAGTTVDVPINLTGGAWHWAARTLPDGGAPTEWVAFGGNAENEADFTVTGTIIVIDPAPPEDDGGGSKGCGLLGIEPVLLFLLIGARKRTSCVRS